jgi:hypothetical protein
MVVTMAALLFAASLTAAAVAPTVEIVPDVLMPMIVDGYDYGKQKKDTTWFVLGGRGVHTAESYFNQVAVGNSLRAQKVVVREEFFLQTKIESMGSVESTIATGEDDLAQLGMDYVDLLLIHTPYLGWGEPYSNSSQGAAGKAARQATWRGMEALQRAGKAKAKGVELQRRRAAGDYRDRGDRGDRAGGQSGRLLRRPLGQPDHRLPATAHAPHRLSRVLAARRL